MRRRANVDSSKGHAAKYRPGLDPLERETQISDIRPLDADEQKRMFEMVELMLERGGLGSEEKKALRIWKTNLLAENLEGHVRGEFLRDFWAWLLGRGKEDDHKKCWWYRQSLADDPQVAAYIDIFIKKMHVFKVKLELLSRRRPLGINQCYLFFKYIVRGEPGGENSKFLKDWDIFVDEFDVARREFGQDHVDKNSFPHPHETAPYNEGDGAAAAVNPRRDIAQKRENDDNLTEKLVDGFKGGPKPGGGGAGVSSSSSDSDDDDDMDTSSVDATVVDQHVDAMNRQTAAIEQLTNALLSPEKRMQYGQQGAAVGHEEVARLQGQIQDLTRRLEDKQMAKQPADDERRLLDQADAQRKAAEAQMAQFGAMLEQIRADHERQHRERQAQFGDLVHRLEGAVKSQESGPLAEADQGAEFRRNFAEFLVRFQDYVNRSDARMMEIESNMRDGAGDEGPQLLELGEIGESLNRIAGLLQSRPDIDYNQLRLANEANGRAIAAEMLLEWRKQNGNLETAIGRIEQMHREEMQKGTLLIGSMKDWMDKMQVALRNNDVTLALTENQNAVRELVRQLPAANAALLNDWVNSTQQNFGALAQMHASLNRIEGDMRQQMEARIAEYQHERLQAAQVIATQAATIAQLQEQETQRAQELRRIAENAGGMRQEAAARIGQMEVRAAQAVQAARAENEKAAQARQQAELATAALAEVRRRAEAETNMLRAAQARQERDFANVTASLVKRLDKAERLAARIEAGQGQKRRLEGEAEPVQAEVVTEETAELLQQVRQLEQEPAVQALIAALSEEEKGNYERADNSPRALRHKLSVIRNVVESRKKQK